MKKIVLFFYALAMVATTNAQLSVVNSENAENYQTIYQSSLGYYVIRYYPEKGGFYLFGKTDNQNETKMLSIKLGETIESAIQTLNDLSKLDFKDSDLYVKGMDDMKIRIFYFKSPFVNTYGFESEGIAGRCWLNNINFKKAIKEVEKFSLQ